VEPGQTVIDIGSGAGIDCLLAAQKVGPAGRVIGVDMTPIMIEKARNNAERAGLTNVEFRMGQAERLPVESDSADWIISNCVINLSPDKPGVFRELFRAMRPGGRLSISDIMVEELPWFLRRSGALYAACVAGAIPESRYVQGLRNAGFTDVRVTERIVYDRDQVIHLLDESRILGPLTRYLRPLVMRILDRYIVGKVWSAKVTGAKGMP
jgi:ubiquinone/menaquinone biosynthesis C-methylase UbiE